MKRVLLIVTLLAILPGMYGQNLLQNAVSEEDLSSILISRESYVPVPGLQDREAWGSIPQVLRDAYISNAVELLDYEWPSISATTTRLFVTTGDRDEYQGLSFPKRRNLGVLVLAEASENKGRFMDQILNGIWSICEESDWGVPAHYKSTSKVSGLPDVTNPWVDLFAAETVNFLAWTDYLLGEKLDSISPLIL